MSDTEKAIGLAYPTYSILKRHEKKLEDSIGRISKMRVSGPVSELYCHLKFIRDFLKVYESLEEKSQEKILQKM
ncbi:MAG: hypothetical protein WC262_12685 [Bacteroidales bacterium]|jgi:hypothetical protein